MKEGEVKTVAMRMGQEIVTGAVMAAMAMTTNWTLGVKEGKVKTVAKRKGQEMATGAVTALMAITMNWTLVVEVHLHLDLCHASPVCVVCVHLCCENAGGNVGKRGLEEVNQA